MPPLDGDDRPLERRHAHDVEARDALTAQLALVRLARRAVARGLALRLEPRLVRRADLGRAERAGRVLLVREQQERDAEDLWRAQDRVWACLRVSGGSMGEGAGTVAHRRPPSPRRGARRRTRRGRRGRRGSRRSTAARWSGCRSARRGRRTAGS
jgi:hypothetical protein